MRVDIVPDGRKHGEESQNDRGVVHRIGSDRKTDWLLVSLPTLASIVNVNERRTMLNKTQARAVQKTMTQFAIGPQKREPNGAPAIFRRRSNMLHRTGME